MEKSDQEDLEDFRFFAICYLRSKGNVMMTYSTPFLKQSVIQRIIGYLRMHLSFIRCMNKPISIKIILLCRFTIYSVGSQNSSEKRNVMH